MEAWDTKGIADRIEQLAMRFAPQPFKPTNTGLRELDRRAGLTEGTCGVLRDRFRANPDASAETKTLRAICRAGGVSFFWLLTGRGPERGVVRLGDVDGWPAAAASAGLTPDIARVVGDTVPPEQLGRVTATVARMYAVAWAEAAVHAARPSRTGLAPRGGDEPPSPGRSSIASAGAVEGEIDLSAPASSRAKKKPKGKK